MSAAPKAEAPKTDTGIVNIHGKAYQTVALRVRTFRTADKGAEYGLITEIIHRDNTSVVMRARIEDPSGRVIATGHAEEYRQASAINKTSALENAETSAIGRALAGLGLGGTEFASADEVARAVSGAKPAAPYPSAVQSTIQHEGVRLEAEQEAKCIRIGTSMIDLVAQEKAENIDNAWNLYELWEQLQDAERLWLWEWFGKPFSNTRTRVKAVSVQYEAQKQKGKKPVAVA